MCKSFHIRGLTENSIYIFTPYTYIYHMSYKDPTIYYILSKKSEPNLNNKLVTISNGSRLLGQTVGISFF